VGRPRTRPVGESTILSLKVEDELIRALDEAAKTMSAEQPAGRASISRGELVRIALHEWLATYKARSTKPRS
jgi:predicted transcriptional regulator